MGQYFKLVNPDRKEYVTLPGPMKAIERLTNHHAMAAVGYLLLQGPQDGTAFTHMNADPDDWDYDRNERLAEKGEMMLLDKERWENEPERTAYQAGRVYQSHKDIAEANDYAGRWAGDTPVLVGDYDDSGLYGATRPKALVELDGTTYVVEYVEGPIVESSIKDPNNVHTAKNRDLETGDTVSVKATNLPDAVLKQDSVEVVGGRQTDHRGEPRVYAKFVEWDDGDWTNITEGLMVELDEFLGDYDFGEGTVMRPDMVFST